jgi:hypothetical protein
MNGANSPGLVPYEFVWQRRKSWLPFFEIHPMPDRKKPAMVRVQILDEPGNPTEMKTVNMDEVRPTSETRSALSAEQEAGARVLWHRIGRTARPDVDEAGRVKTFTHEQDADRELLVWDAIATVVEDL